MKKILLPIFIVAIVLSSCNSEKREAKRVAQAYLDAMANYDPEAARPYASEQTQKTTIETISKFFMPKLDSTYIQKNTPATITINDILIEGDTTATVLYHKVTPIQQFDDTLTLIKENGEWKAFVLIKVPMGLDNLGIRERPKPGEMGEVRRVTPAERLAFDSTRRARMDSVIAARKK